MKKQFFAALLLATNLVTPDVCAMKDSLKEEEEAKPLHQSNNIHTEENTNRDRFVRCVQKAEDKLLTALLNIFPASSQYAPLVEVIQNEINQRKQHTMEPKE